MAELTTGKLIWRGEGKDRKRLLSWQTKKGGMSIANRFPEDQLASDLRNSQQNEIEVVLELESGQPRRIRSVGKDWTEHTPSGAQSQRKELDSSMKAGKDLAKAQSGVHVGSPNVLSREGTGRPEQPLARRSQSQFHNPYNFVPALPRDERVRRGPLGDEEPAGHDRYHSNRYTGRLPVTLTAITPLLSLDASRVTITGPSDTAHKTYPIFIGSDEKPQLQPTSVKGMLRSAYEAVTNSRLSVFVKHEERLAFRGPATGGVRVVPARIEKLNGDLHVVLYTGTSAMNSDGSPVSGDPVYAAWLRRHKDHAKPAANLAGQHGDHVWAYITRWNHPPFDFWNVVELRPFSASKPSNTDQPNDNRATSWKWKDKQGNEQTRYWNRASPSTTPSGQWIEGYVCHTNENIRNKHDERVFFKGPGSPAPVKVDPVLGDKWRDLIKNYRREHEDEKRKLPLRPTNAAEWSRHIERAHQEEELKEGTLCYARVEPNGATWRVLELYPVMISRRVYEVSPVQLVDTSLMPAQSLSELSPADRVFGWVRQKKEKKGDSGKEAAYRGHIRVGSVECQTAKEQSVDEFSNGLPLNILGQPKPQQGRFYVARNRRGEAQPDRLTTPQAGYSLKSDQNTPTSDKGLRGRKVYPHHKLTLDKKENGKLTYWDSSKDYTVAVMPNGLFQEYRRPGMQKDKQNRSIQGWVKPDAKFQFDIHVTNLSKVEIGALVWLLQLPPDTFHRFGGGKPLGFGSVRLDLGRPDVRTGAELIKRYSSLEDMQPEQCELKDCVTAFKKALLSAYAMDFREKGEHELEEEYQKDLGEKFTQIGFIAAFLRSAQGFDDNLPIHYPRTRPQGTTGHPPPNPEGESFKWFVENARETQHGVSRGHVLGNLVDDPGLPILEHRLEQRLERPPNRRGAGPRE